MKNLFKIILFLLLFTTSLYAQPSGGITRIWDGNDIALVSAGKALLVDGSASTQPVSGTVTCNAGTNLNTSALATSANQSSELTFLGTIQNNTSDTTAYLAAVLGDTTALLNIFDVFQDDGSAAPTRGIIVGGRDSGNNFQQFATNTSGNQQVGVIAQTTNGYTPVFISGLVGTVTSVKSSAAGTLGAWQWGNPAATWCYIQIFDVATAGAVTLGTTVPKKVLPMPAGSAGNVPAVSPGTLFANGIQVASTTTATGSTPCGTGTDVSFDFK